MRLELNLLKIHSQFHDDKEDFYNFMMTRKTVFGFMKTDN
jgi:hypothetical protein